MFKLKWWILCNKFPEENSDQSEKFVHEALYRVPSPPWSLISHGQSGTENSGWCWFPIRAGDLALRFTRKKLALSCLEEDFHH